MDARSAVNNGFLRAVSPRSDVTQCSSSSSYDDGPAESGSIREFPRTEHRMYVINRAGTGEASYLLLADDESSILSYRVHTETWRPCQGVMHFGVVVLGQSVYIIGGFHRARAVCLNRMIRYDACEGDWTECASMAQARAKFGTCVVDGKIFVCGGERTDGKITGGCERYDPETDTWEKSGLLLAPRAFPACAASRKELICAGGCHGGTSHNNLWIYEQHYWQEMDAHYPHRLPYNIDRCAVATYGNTFYFLGGVSAHFPKERQRQEHHDAHNNSTNNNNNNKSKSNKSRKTTKTSNNTKNKNNNNDYGDDISLSPNEPQSNNSLSDSESKPVGNPDTRPQFQTERRVFSYSMAISANSPAHSSTGSAHTGPQPDMISPWNLKLPPMIHARHSAGAITIGTKIHVIGGTSIETGQAVKISEHLDLTTGQWDEDFTLRRCDLSSVCCVKLEVPKVPLADRKNTYRLRWVMW